MTWGAVGIGAVTMIGGMVQANQQRQAAKGMMNAQNDAQRQAMAAQQAQFDAISRMLAPYVNAGTGALGHMNDLAGINGSSNQQAAIQAIQNSPQFKMMTRQGEQGILANASATGGLRGGNVQGALAQFRPQVLSQLIDQQYARLGGIASMGENAATRQGMFGQNFGQQQANGFNMIGANTAGGIAAGSAADQNQLNALMQGAGYVGFGLMNRRPNNGLAAPGAPAPSAVYPGSWVQPVLPTAPGAIPTPPR